MPKLTLIQVAGRSYYCSGRLSVGAYMLTSGSVVLIDSGIDKDTAKDVDRAVQEAGYAVAAIINTHHHPDHCGGNAYFQKQYPQLRIVASAFEKIFIENPYLQPLCFCAGAQPFGELRNKYLEAPASVVTDTIAPYQDQEIEIDGERFGILALPGHTAGSVGVVTPDGVLYCGDALLGQEAFDKHGMMLYTNIADALATFEKLAAFPAPHMVFYHGGATREVAAVAAAHKERVLQTRELVLAVLAEAPEGLPLDLLTQTMMQRRSVPDNVMQFILTRTTVGAYVADLSVAGRVVLVVEQGLLRFKAK